MTHARGDANDEDRARILAPAAFATILAFVVLAVTDAALHPRDPPGPALRLGVPVLTLAAVPLALARFAPARIPPAAFAPLAALAGLFVTVPVLALAQGRLRLHESTSTPAIAALAFASYAALASLVAATKPRLPHAAARALLGAAAATLALLGLASSKEGGLTLVALALVALAAVAMRALRHEPTGNARLGAAALALPAGIAILVLGFLAPSILHVALAIAIGGASAVWGAGTLVEGLGESSA